MNVYLRMLVLLWIKEIRLGIKVDNSVADLIDSLSVLTSL